MIRIYKFPSIKQHQAAQSLPGCWVKVCLEAWLTAVICGLERAWNELGTEHLNGSDGLKDNATHVDVNLKTWEE